MTDLDLDSAVETFAQEAKELLDEMENSLLALEDTPDDDEMINSLFRAMHTIKGSSGLFGFDVIGEDHVKDPRPLPPCFPILLE